MDRQHSRFIPRLDSRKIWGIIPVSDTSVTAGRSESGVIAILAQWLANKAVSPNKPDPRFKASLGSYPLSAFYWPVSTSRALAARPLLAALRPGIMRCNSARRVKAGTQAWVSTPATRKALPAGRRRMLGSIRDRGRLAESPCNKGKAALSPPGQVVQYRISSTVKYKPVNHTF